MGVYNEAHRCRTISQTTLKRRSAILLFRIAYAGCYRDNVRYCHYYDPII